MDAVAEREPANGRIRESYLPTQPPSLSPIPAIMDPKEWLECMSPSPPPLSGRLCR